MSVTSQKYGVIDDGNLLVVRQYVKNRLFQIIERNLLKNVLEGIEHFFQTMNNERISHFSLNRTKLLPNDCKWNKTEPTFKQFSTSLSPEKISK